MLQEYGPEQFTVCVESNPRLQWFTWLRCMIGLENSRRSLNQSNFKLKPNVAWSLAFSRALDSLLGFFSLTSHWLLMTFSPLWLAVVITLFLVQQHPIESCEVSCRYHVLFVPDWSLISDWDRFKQKCHIVNLSQAIFSFLYRNGQRGQTSLSWKRCRWSTATYF